MDPQFKELVDEINSGLDKRFTEVVDQINKGVDARLGKFEIRSKERMKMHFENLEGLVKATADGYAMNLDRIERKIDDLQKQVRTGLDDHDQILANHSGRITTLEKAKTTRASTDD